MVLPFITFFTSTVNPHELSDPTTLSYHECFQQARTTSQLPCQATEAPLRAVHHFLTCILIPPEHSCPPCTGGYIGGCCGAHSQTSHQCSSIDRGGRQSSTSCTRGCATSPPSLRTNQTQYNEELAVVELFLHQKVHWYWFLSTALVTAEICLDVHFLPRLCLFHLKMSKFSGQASVVKRNLWFTRCCV